VTSSVSSNGAPPAAWRNALVTRLMTSIHVRVRAAVSGVVVTQLVTQRRAALAKESDLPRPPRRGQADRYVRSKGDQQPASTVLPHSDGNRLDALTPAVPPAPALNLRSPPAPQCGLGCRVAHPSPAPGRHTGGARPHKPRDRPRALRGDTHGRDAPDLGVPQTAHHHPLAATRRARPRGAVRRGYRCSGARTVGVRPR
jgi:hypothetical protein